VFNTPDDATEPGPRYPAQAKPSTLADPDGEPAHTRSEMASVPTEPPLQSPLVIRKTPLHVVRGFLMGAADVVPGVSGGTIALVLGIYERLIDSIHSGSSALGNLVRGDLAGARRWVKKVDWWFLVPLVAGILLAVLTLAKLIENLLQDHPEEMAGLFSGLIAGSVVIAWRLVKRWNATTYVILAVVAVLMFVLLGLREGTSQDTVGQLASPALWAFFLAGAVAICAMILPGISGSFLLVILGMYGPVISAVNDRSLLTLIVLVAGMVLGLALFSQLLSWSLRHHHDKIVAALIGLMAGSLRVLWPWPGGLDSTVLGAPGSNVVGIAVLAVVALGVVLALGKLGERVARPNETDRPTERVG
jgi:putative membrane protein